ncbi:tegument protein/FGARATc [Murine herpesvirus strain 4556]|uniref:75c n=2 Tax=Orthoherpesviridae TaxID=3044472 RepID=O41976_MHV68|nr:tegument protein/FGARATc [Murid gammaherpesvirus 4]AXP99160.1 unknown protein [synthetic construct]QJQ80265.1 tegument protein/FGARATc [Murine herpesvirus]UNZ86706.1 tegument protein/FGARATc [Murine herpesvirus strain 72]UNZ86783.1 tegument protein/FGARATc [Murine herpesvirus strain 4556]AAB66458.1 tegument protein/FGARATc [Murid gammaherpesvirus 4]
MARHFAFIYFGDSQYNETEKELIEDTEAGRAPVDTSGHRFINIVCGSLIPSNPNNVNHEHVGIYKRIIQHAMSAESPRLPVTATPIDKSNSSRALALSYGPNTRWRPTTVSRELAAYLHDLIPEYSIRIESFRRVICTLENTPTNISNTRLLESAYGFLEDHFTANTVLSIMRPESAIENYETFTHSMLVSAPAPPPDPLTMKITYPNTTPLDSVLNHCSLGTYHRENLYPTMLHETLSTKFPMFLGQSADVQTAHWHTCSMFFNPGWVLENIYFASSWITGIDFQHSALGLYTLHPPEDQQPFHLVNKRSRAVLKKYSSLMRAMGLPICGGFSRPIRTTHALESGQDVLINASVTGTVPQNRLSTQDPRPGDLIVFLGDFVPTLHQETAPYLYTHSPLELNKILAVVKQLSDTTTQSCITKTIRPFGHPSMLEALTELIHPYGAYLDLNNLPQPIVSALNSSAPAIHEEIVKHHFLSVHCPVYLLVISQDLGLEDAAERDATHNPLDMFLTFAENHKLPCGVIGTLVEDRGLHFCKELFDGGFPVKIEFTAQEATVPRGRLPRSRSFSRHKPMKFDQSFLWTTEHFNESVEAILKHPAVESKEYIVKHIDRLGQYTVGQQQGCGPLDLPVCDHSIMMCTALKTTPQPLDASGPRPTFTTLRVHSDSALDLINSPTCWLSNKEYSKPEVFPCVVTGVGEQYYKMQVDPVRGAVYGLVEAILNMLTSNCVHGWRKMAITGSISWSSDDPSYSLLYQTLMACKDFCYSLSIPITYTNATSGQTQDTGPRPGPTTNSIAFTAQCPGVMGTYRKTTPDFKSHGSYIIWLPMSQKLTLAGTIFQQISKLKANKLHKLAPEYISNLAHALEMLTSRTAILSMHDVSDGGLIAAILEMAMAGNKGCNIEMPSYITRPFDMLISETPGMVIEVEKKSMEMVKAILKFKSLTYYKLGQVAKHGEEPVVEISHAGKQLFKAHLSTVMRWWRHTYSSHITQQCSNLSAKEKLYVLDYGNNKTDLGLMGPGMRSRHLRPVKCVDPDFGAYVCVACSPGQPPPHSLMSALSNSGFDPVPCNILELAHTDLNEYSGIIFSGHSGAEKNVTAASILANSLVTNQDFTETLTRFYNKSHTFILGFGELGTQLLLALDIVNLDQSNPQFISRTEERELFQHGALEPNASALLECLWLNFYVRQSRSVFLAPISGSVVPAWAVGTHLGINFNHDGAEQRLMTSGQISATFHGPEPGRNLEAAHYPRNPSGASNVAAFCSPDGRATAMLIDPSQSFFPWQWQYDAENLQCTPWQICFFRLLLWSLASRD